MRLKTREKNFLRIGAVVLAAIFFYLGIVEPLISQRDRYRTQANQLEIDISQMRVLASQYRSAAEARQHLVQQIQDRGSDFKPISYLETVAREAGLTNQIESITPVSAGAEENSDLSLFDLRLNNFSLDQLVQFLYRIETSDKVFFIQTLNVKPRYLTPKILDVSMRLATPRPS